MKLQMAAFLSLALISASCKSSTSSDNTSEQDFKYTVDQFADIKVIRYQVPGWDELSLEQKAYAYYLSEAAKFGYDIHWDQNCKHNLQLRHALEKILTSYSGDKENQEYKDFEEYAKRVFFSAGIHHHYAEDKFFPKCSQEFFTTLLNSVDADTELLIPYIYDPAVFPQRRSTSADGDIVKLSAVNFYDGVSRQEVEEYYKKIQNPDDPHPIAYGLNTKVVKENGQVIEKAWKADGIYGPAITKICEMLSKAREHAESESQRKALDLLIGYYTTGDLREWDAYNIEWLQDTTGTIDYVNGFIEDYNDPLGRKGSWEGHVNIKDPSASRRSTILSDNAQWFEDNSPVDARFKKEKVKGVSAKVINAVCLSGDAFPSTPIGINLPNQDWIRRDHGSKSVTIANITDAYTFSAAENPKNGLDEFEHDEAVKVRERTYGSHSDNIHTDLHECLGHGSGKLLPGVSSTAMGEFSSTLEEARADLFGLWYCADPKMVELGIMPDMEAYKAAYSKFIRNGLMVQFSRIELGRNNTEAHMQDRQLIAQWCFENGNGVIRKVTHDGKTYFEITDYEALRGLFGKLLAEIQRIKSEGDYAAGKALVEKYAVKIDYDLHKEVIERYTTLELKPYGGFINPTIVPVVKNGETIDYKLEYPSDFLGQMLEYGARYSTL